MRPFLWARTDEDRAEEERDGDVDDRRRHIQKPVWGHGEKSEEEQEEEQTVPVLLYLEQDRDKTGILQLRGKFNLRPF